MAIPPKPQWKREVLNWQDIEVVKLAKRSYDVMLSLAESYDVEPEDLLDSFETMIANNEIGDAIDLIHPAFNPKPIAHDVSIEEADFLQRNLKIKAVKAMANRTGKSILDCVSAIQEYLVEENDWLGKPDQEDQKDQREHFHNEDQW